MTLLDIAYFAFAAMGLWTALAWCFNVLVDGLNGSRERMKRLDGPCKVSLIAVMSFGCGISNKTIVLENMPSTLVIHRGTDVSEEQCNKTKTWGCAQRFPKEDKCVISLDWDRALGVTVHELTHCAGHKEDEAQALTAPEL